MQLESLKDLYLEQLEALHSAEVQLLDVLPRMAGAASAPDLKQAFSEHLRQTQEHVEKSFSSQGTYTE